MTVRSQCIFSLLAAGGLLFALLSPSHAQQAADKAQDDPLIASINEYEIRESDVYSQIEALPLGDQVQVRQAFAQFAESVVREEILFHALMADNFAGEPELRQKLMDFALSDLIERRVTSQLDVSEEDIQKFYDENKSAIRGENLRASQIVLASSAECESVLGSVKSDAEFAELARSRSTDAESAARDGDIGYMMPHEGPLGFELELFELQPGQMKIIAADAGCRVVRVTERVTPDLPPLGMVRARIEDILRRSKQAELLQKLLTDAEAKVVVKRTKKTP